MRKDYTANVGSNADTGSRADTGSKADTGSRGATPDTEFTLPSVVSAVQGRYERSALFLTVLFHPDTSRIGQVAQVPEHDPAMPWVLGRRSPVFAHRKAPEGEPLRDPYVSRRAIEFEYKKGSLLLTRFSGSSRVRLGGSELREPRVLDAQALEQGVTLLLGHAVVLFLRMAAVPAIKNNGFPSKGLLRGDSAAIQSVHEQIALAAAGTDDVLIRGETGTGKELVANAIHMASIRAQSPIVSVNMAAIPTELAPSALFGSARGAFTGADKRTEGFFEQANGGTLFLDEIGDCPTEVQAQLLRALQEREIQVVGGEVRRVDVRVVSATDAPLEEEHHFKAALLHRLGSYEIFLPPLRERVEDIGQLLFHFATLVARESARDDLLPNADSNAVDLAAWAFFVFQASRYHWPGNVRELSNVVRQVVLTAPDAMSLVEVFERNISRRRPPAQGFTTESEIVSAVVPAMRRMADISATEFASAMDECDFEPARVARKLQVSRTAVYRRVEGSTDYRLANDISEPELRDAMVTHADDVVAVAASLKVSLAGLRQRLRSMPGPVS